MLLFRTVLFSQQQFSQCFHAVGHPVCTILFQFAGFRVAVPHPDAGHAAFLCSEDIVLPVADHHRLRRLLLRQSQPTQCQTNHVRLGFARPMNVTAGHSRKVLKQVKMLQDPERIDLRLGSRHCQHIAVFPQLFQQLPEKKIKLLQGGCPIHAALTAKDVRLAKEAHPHALMLVHPECRPVVCEQADYIGSTSGIVNYAMQSDAKEFIIGTEISIAETLQNACPEKRFYPLAKKLICENMKSTTLMDIYHILKDGEGTEIQLDSKTIAKARCCIDRMIALGG